MAVQTVDELNKRLRRHQDGMTVSGERSTPKGTTLPTQATPERSDPKPATQNLPERSDPKPGMGGFADALGERPRQTTNVSDIAADMMSDDSRLMQRADTEGRQIANRRGLLNSSMSAQASQNAVLDRIVPMASQESSQRHEGAMANQQFGFAQALSEQEHSQGMESQAADQQHQLTLSMQEFQQAANLSDQEFQQQMGISRQEFEQRYEMQERVIGAERFLAELDAETREGLMQMERDMRESLANMEINADERNNMTSMVTSMHEHYQESMRSILNNPDMSAEDRNALLRSASDLLQLQTSMIENLYDVEIDWDASGFDPVGPTSEEGDEASGGSGSGDSGSGGSGSGGFGSQPGTPGYSDPYSDGNVR